MIKTAKELVNACLNVVNNFKTIYVLSCFGAPMNASNKARYSKADPARAASINAASADTFGFDCVCFIKGLFWGWKGDPNQVYGGAQYKSNNIPDISADGLIKICTEVSTDFSNIVPGELVWLPGHVGIYVGDGLAAEATFEPVSGVQLQCVLPMGVKNGMPATGWQKHGKLPWISYEPEIEVIPEKIKKYNVTLELEGVDEATMNEMKATAAKNNWKFSVQEVVENKPVQPAPAPVQPKPETPWTPKEGDVVYFKGGLQYSQANGTVSSERPAGQAKITKTAPGKLHPWHLVKTGSQGPYGWVDLNTFEKI